MSTTAEARFQIPRHMLAFEERVLAERRRTTAQDFRTAQEWRTFSQDIERMRAKLTLVEIGTLFGWSRPVANTRTCNIAALGQVLPVVWPLLEPLKPFGLSLVYDIARHDRARQFDFAQQKIAHMARR